MKPLESAPPYYWAPEVTYSNGRFYLYYSAGNEAQMELRVATSEFPDRDYVDTGKRLTSAEFAIDAHVFLDEDGKKYLFYATDFLDHTHIGTGTVVDEMIDWFTLAETPYPVTRAKYDWQVYDPVRKEKGGVRWHTVEGPFVLKRKGLYYEMFSGGNWQNVSYGVSFAVSSDLTQRKEWTQFSDGEKILPILRTVPDRVIGPGHNSVIRGPNNRELYCIYHSWVDKERVLAIDRMDFAGERIFILGATDTSQPAPFSPTFIDFFDGAELSDNWRATGNWSLENNSAVCGSSEKNELVYLETGETVLCEFYLRSLEAPQRDSSVGFRLSNERETILEFGLFPNEKQARIFTIDKPAHVIDLPPDFVYEVFHLVRIEIDGLQFKLMLDENALNVEGRLEKSCTGIALVSNKMGAAFSSFTLTEGFEDLFDHAEHEKLIQGWQKSGSDSYWAIKDQCLSLSHKGETESVIYKGELHSNYEFAANVRLEESLDTEWAFGFLLMKNPEEEISRFTIEGRSHHSNISIDAKKIENFCSREFHQFRFLIMGGKVRFELEGILIDEFTAPDEGTRIAIFCRNASIFIDMARLTVL